MTFSGITGRAGLVAMARQLMTIRPHRDAGPDGVTVITKTQDESSGYAGFTDAELIPHTDGSAVPNPPGLLLLACQQPPTRAEARESPTAPASSGRSPTSTPPPCGRCPHRKPPSSGRRAPTSAPRWNQPGQAGHASGSGSMTWPGSRPGRRGDPAAATAIAATRRRSGSARAKACCSATPGGCTAATTSPAAVPCSASSATPCQAPRYVPGFPFSRADARRSVSTGGVMTA